MAVVAVAVLVVAGRPAPRDGTSDDRLYALAGELKCLQCVGESVAASQAPLAQKFRAEIRDQMSSGATDDEILAWFADRYGEEVLLSPPSAGAGGLVWVLPVLVVAGAAAGVGGAVRRWRHEAEAARSGSVPTTGSTGRRRAVAAGALGVVFVAVAGWLVATSSGDRGAGTPTGAQVGGTASEVARCQPISMQDPEDGIDCFDEVLADAPDDVAALTYRGWARVRAGDVSGGGADLARAVELDPTFPDVRVFRAVVAADAGDFVTAAEELEVFWANDPSPVAQQVVGSEGLDRKVFFGLMSSPTRSCWQSAAEGGGEGSTLDQAFLDRLGACLDGVLAITPGDRDARLSRALAHVGPERSDPEAARALLDALLADDPDDADALSLGASLDVASGDFEAATTALDHLDELPRGAAAFLIGDAATIRAALEAARTAQVPNPDGG
jgi:cytochrome c-type biogenesis protein CcmH/NrfF